MHVSTVPPRAHSPRRRSVPCLITALAAVVTLGHIPAAQAGRPLTIDDANPVPRHVFQIESGLGFATSGSTEHWDVPVALTYGVLSNFAIGVGCGGQYETSDADQTSGIGREISDVKDLTLGGKFRFVDESKNLPALAAAGTIKFALSDSDDGLGTGFNDYDLTLLATKHLGKTAFDANVGFTYRAGDSTANELHFGVAVRQPLNDRLTVVGEIFAVQPLSGDDISAAVAAGLQFKAWDNFVIDGAIGAGLTDVAPDFFARIGFTLRF